MKWQRVTKHILSLLYVFYFPSQTFTLSYTFRVTSSKQSYLEEIVTSVSLVSTCSITLELHIYLFSVTNPIKVLLLHLLSCNLNTDK